MTLNGNSLTTLKALVSVKVGTSVTAREFSRIKVGEDIYRLAPDVQILKSSGKTFIGMSIYEASDLIGKTVNLYADKAASLGGLVRVITVN